MNQTTLDEREARHRQYDYEHGLSEGRFTWYLGLIMLGSFILMESVFVYRGVRFGYTVGTLFLEIFMGVTIVALLMVLTKDRKRLFKPKDKK